MKKQKIIISILLAILVILSIGVVSNAEQTPQLVYSENQASLTIIQYGRLEGNTENTLLENLEFTIYKVSDDVETVADAQIYIQDKTAYTDPQETDSNGIVTFSNLELGRYYVVETNIPENVLTEVESFLIDLPSTSSTGDSWEYDIVVSPKPVVINGEVTLTNKNAQGQIISGSTWKVQKQDSSNGWEDYEEIGILTTDNLGQVNINSLGKGIYRFVQISVPEEYILNQTQTVNFTIDEDNKTIEVEAINEIIDLKQYVKLRTGEYGYTVSRYTSEASYWKTVVDIPSFISDIELYKITEELQDGLVYVANSMKIYGIDEDGEETIIAQNLYNLTVNNQNILITFKNNNTLENYKSLAMYFTTKFDSDKVMSGEYTVTASINYTKNININGQSVLAETKNDSAIVYTGAVLVKIVDESGNPLSGAQFKIMISEGFAKKNTFLNNASGSHIVATSDTDGYVVFGGLRLGGNDQEYSKASQSYWIVETQAPSYEENGKIKYYNLLEDPVEVKVTANSGVFSDSTTIIVNKKGIELPLTGGRFFYILVIIGVFAIITGTILYKRNKKEVVQ